MFKKRTISKWLQAKGFVSAVLSFWRPQTGSAKIVMAGMLTLCMSSNVLAETIIHGVTINSVQSTQGEARSYSTGLNGLVSIRPNIYYGNEFQLGVFGQSGQFNYSILLDGAATGFLPFGSSGVSLFAKAGLAIIYSVEPNNLVNIFAPTYGVGIEYKGKKRVVRLGVQHYKVGNESLSPSISANLIGISSLSIVD